jgi:L-alanine-DL-glutamate epimerase-like enolase superfamily enzyme
MRITKVEALPVTAMIDEPVRIATTVFTEVRATIVRVTADEGLVGIGECLVRSAPRATASIVEDMLAPRIIGMDPMDAGSIWWEMFSAMRTRGHTKGVVLEAMSGIDVAVWDIIGKATGMPTFKALHGYGRRVLPAYASSIFMGDVAEMASQAERFMESGYRAMKIKIGADIDRDEEAVKAIRSAVGDSVKLMVDCNSAYDAGTAVRLGRRLEKYEIEWLEEPVPPYDLKGYEAVRAGQPIPLASGEGEFTTYGFRDLLATGAISYAQPDLGRVGGFTEGMRVAALAHASNVYLAPHTGMCSALNIVATMHFAAAAPGFFMFEFMEVNHPLMDIFTTPIPKPVNGVITPPSEPGIGVELDMGKLERWIER